MLANCETASIIARRIGLPPGVCSGLLDIFEWWNGGGGPKKVRGEQISLVARLVNVAGYAVFFDRVGGRGAAAQAINQRSGGYLDPAIAADFQRRPRQLLEPTDAGDLSDRLLATEPRPHTIVEPAAMEEVLRVFGETVDLKTPFLHGHSAAVSALGDGACRALGLGDDQVSLARRVGYVQDIGRVAVPSAIWEHQGPLGSDAWMQVRLHAYHSEQILSRCAPLLPLAAVAGLHHDRLDGSGYHRGATAVLLSMTARVLAAADVRHALVSERPHRPAHPPHRASALLRAEANAGRLDHDAVRAVIAAAEGGWQRRAPSPTCRVDRQAGRGSPARRPRAVKPGDQRNAGHLTAHRGTSRPGRLRPDRCVQPGRCRDVRHVPRSAHAAPRLVVLPTRPVAAVRDPDLVRPERHTDPRRAP